MVILMRNIEYFTHSNIRYTVAEKKSQFCDLITHRHQSNRPNRYIKAIKRQSTK